MSVCSCYGIYHNQHPYLIVCYTPSNLEFQSRINSTILKNVSDGNNPHNGTYICVGLFSLTWEQFQEGISHSCQPTRTNSREITEGKQGQHSNTKNPEAEVTDHYLSPGWFILLSG